MLKQLLITALAVFAGDATAAHAVERTMLLPGIPAATGTAWQPALLVREQTIAPADRAHPVLYVHGGTFPSASSVMFRFNGVSWADELNKAGFSVWSFDFAGFGAPSAIPAWPRRHPRPASRWDARLKPRSRSRASFAAFWRKPELRRCRSSRTPGAPSPQGCSSRKIPTWSTAWCSSARSHAACNSRPPLHPVHL